MFWGFAVAVLFAAQSAAPPSPIDAPALLHAFAQHEWVLVGAIGINLLVGFVKQGWAGDRLQALLPKRAIPFVAPGLGVLGLATAEFVGGKPWPVALLDGLGAGILAVFGHETIVEAARGGKEIVPPAPDPPLPPPPLPPPPIEVPS